MLQVPRQRCTGGVPFLTLAMVTAAAVTLVPLPAGAAGPVKRARPPQFSKAVTDAFFPNALEKLVGPRPQWSPSWDAPTAAPSSPSSVNRPAEPSPSNWSAVITADALEDEIKAQTQALGATIENVLQFKGGRYQSARSHLSLLAVLLAIDAQYDQRVRWQQDAAAIRDALARAGFNCKVGTDASYQEARLRLEDLQTLVRGGTLALPAGAADASWPEVADRAPLMKRLEEALEGRIKPAVANAGTFASRIDQTDHEAQLVAALAVVIAGERYEFADDESFAELAAGMRGHALALRAAIAENDYDAARRHVGEISKSCASCHESYRN